MTFLIKGSQDLGRSTPQSAELLLTNKYFDFAAAAGSHRGISCSAATVSESLTSVRDLITAKACLGLRLAAFHVMKRKLSMILCLKGRLADSWLCHR